MTPFHDVTARPGLLLQPNIDTDVIIPINRLSLISKDRLGPYAFEAWRYLENGEPDPEFFLNRPQFNDCPILITGPNFGCGSSREAAVWALMGTGIRCIIAPSFGDIFFGNAFENGLLPIRLPDAELQALVECAKNDREVTIDLPTQSVRAEGFDARFVIDPIRKDMLVRGVDGLDHCLEWRDAVRSWQLEARKTLPWLWPGSMDRR